MSAQPFRAMNTGSPANLEVTEESSRKCDDPPRLAAIFQDKPTPNDQHDRQPHVSFPVVLEQRFNPPRKLSLESDDGQPNSRTERILSFLHRKFPSRIVRRVLKCTLAYLLSMLVSIIRPISSAVGPNVFLTTTGTLFSHPARTMGAQFDATVTAALGVCAAILWAMAGLASSVAYNERNLDTFLSDPAGLAINAVFLFVGIFEAQMLRQVYPKFHFFSLQFMIVQIFSMTRGVNLTAMSFSLPVYCGIPLLFGAAISLAVNLFLWPETAVDGMGRALNETLTSSRDMLRMITRQFFLDPQADAVSEEMLDDTAFIMRKGMVKVKTAYREAKYEISFSYVRPQELGVIRKSLGRLTRHLSILGGCLKSERELFESALEAMKRETGDAGTDDDSAHGHDDDDTESEDHDRRKRHTLYDPDSRLLRAAMRATGEYARTGNYDSPRSSKANSRRSSIDEDLSEQNQKSTTSLKHFLDGLPRFSSPRPRLPPKSKKNIDHGDRHLLVTYLESLRDPLMLLSVECADVLDCISNSVSDELDLDDEQDRSIRKTWISYVRHVLKLGKKKSTAEAASDMRARHTPQECNCVSTLRAAIEHFDAAETERMKTLSKLYQKRHKNGELDLGAREELYLVFFFIFTLSEVATEIETMAKDMEELRQRRHDRRKRKHLYLPQLNQKLWQKWSHWSNHQSTRDKGGYSLATLTPHMPQGVRENDVEDEYRLTRIQTSNSLKRQRTRQNSCSTPTSHPISESAPMSHLRHRRRSTLTSSQGGKAHPSVMEPVNEKSRSTSVDLESLREACGISKSEKPPMQLRIRYFIWKRVQYLKRYEFKFALKVAIAVLALCVPAFVPSSEAWYAETRGQWAPMTVIAIMNPTSGGTVEASGWRIIGTLIGAFTAWAALEAGGSGSAGNPYLLAIFACLLAIPFFYIHLSTTYNKVGTVALISYMVVALTRYTNPDPNELISTTVWRRTVAMIIGIGVALVLNSIVWPFVARHAVRKSISGVIYELGDYYSYVMGTYLYHNPEVPPSEDDIKQSTKMESKIQSSIDACSVLLELTDHEPRFKGPFPKEFYLAMIVSTRNLLDRMLIMRTALIKMPKTVKKNVCQQEYQEHRHMLITSMLLHFHTLSSVLRTKFPLPAYMPPTREARVKLIKHRQNSRGGDQWISLPWFAMSCSTEEVIEELEHLTNLIRFIVGESRFAEQAKKMDTFSAL